MITDHKWNYWGWIPNSSEAEKLIVILRQNSKDLRMSWHGILALLPPKMYKPLANIPLSVPITGLFCRTSVYSVSFRIKWLPQDSDVLFNFPPLAVSISLRCWATFSPIQGSACFSNIQIKVLHSCVIASGEKTASNADLSQLFHCCWYQVYFLL